MPLKATALTGSPGATGPVGPTGPQGPQGDPGPPGAPQTPYSGTPANIGAATPGVSADYARGDHVHAGALADLSDVAATAPSSGQVLAWGGSEWAPATPSGGTPSSATPQPIGTASAGVATTYARGDHVHAGNVTGLGDRFERLPLQNRAQFAAAGTRDIQAAIDAHTSGDAAIILAAPGSYPGATVTVGTGKNNLAVIGATGQPYGGTITSLSAGRGLTVNGAAIRIRIQNLQIEGLTTWATSGAGVHRIDRCQLGGGLSVSGFGAAQQLVITDCEVSGTVTIPAGFLGVLIFDHCSFSAGYSIVNGASAAQVVVGNSSGITSATGITLQGWVSNGSGVVTGYQNGVPIGSGSGLPTSQTWSLNFAPTSLASPTLAASGWTLSGFTSGGIQQDTAGNFYELLTPTGSAYFYPTSLTPTSLIPWEVEFDALFTGTTLDGVFGVGVNEETGGKRWRMSYSTASGTFQHIGALGGASALSTPFDVQGNQRIIMGIQSAPRSSRAYFANGQCVGLVNPDGNQAAQTAPQIYGFGNLGGAASTTPIRVYAARVLHNARGTAPPYARIPFPPVQP